MSSDEAAPKVEENGTAGDANKQAENGTTNTETSETCNAGEQSITTPQAKLENWAEEFDPALHDQSAVPVPEESETEPIAETTDPTNTEPESAEPVPDPDAEGVEHGSYYESLVAGGLNKIAAWEIEKLASAGLISETDLDDRAISALKEFSVALIPDVIKEFSTSNLSHVVNKSAYLCGMMKTHRQRVKGQQMAASENKSGPDETVIREILARTGYSLDVTTGQRKYGGPPPDWDGTPPGSGHEVFVGKIPRDVFEDVLIPLFEKCGKIWDLRLMVDSLTGKNRGYAFVTFCEKNGAQEAVKQMNDYEVQPNRKIKVNVSVANMRLFAGNIPKQRTKEEIKEEFSKITEGLVDVIVYQKPEEPHKFNRGFCFLEYETHKHASAAKRKLFQSGRLKMWGCDIIIDWAEPLEEPSDEVMSQVKVLYVRGLTMDVTEEMLKEKFDPYGKVERVKKLKDYGFVHFDDREHAMQALNDLNGQKLGKAVMEVTLAKPQTDKGKSRMMNLRGRGGPMGGGFSRGWGSPRGGGRGGFDRGYHDYPDYHGGRYDDGYGRYDDYGYDDYGYGPPPPRGPPYRPPMHFRGRPPMGRSPMGPRGPPRGGFRGHPRGMPRGSPRGGPTGPRGGMKRPAAPAAPAFDAKKPRNLMDGGQMKWEPEQPIAQQPLEGAAPGYQAAQGQADSQWYSDSW